MITSVLGFMLITLPMGTDKIAHFGLSYAAAHSCQVIIKKATKMSTLKSTVLCAGTTVAIGALKEAVDPALGGKRDKNDLFADIAGVGLAVTIISIDW